MADKTLIKQPHITEKASRLAEGQQYTFVVAKHATAPEVKKAITATYKVKVASVSMINVHPKPRRVGRTMSMTQGYRKAIVKLEKGEKLDILTA